MASALCVRADGEKTDKNTKGSRTVIPKPSFSMVGSLALVESNFLGNSWVKALAI
jgi:hypothetical protein